MPFGAFMLNKQLGGITLFDATKVRLPLIYKSSLFMPFGQIGAARGINGKKPFFSLEQNESCQYTLNRFLEAVKLSRLEDAMSYISKNYIDRVDITELSTAFINENKLCPSYIVKSSFNEGPKNCTKSTFFMVDSQEKKTKIFHVHMLNEPDKYGKWKIYSIEQE